MSHWSQTGEGLPICHHSVKMCASIRNGTMYRCTVYECVCLGNDLKISAENDSGAIVLSPDDVANISPLENEKIRSIRQLLEGRARHVR